jgi:putative transposase
MPHTYSANHVHCVFSTKERADLIREPEALWRYLAGVARGKHIPLIAAGGTANHVHLLPDLPPTILLAQAVRDLKGNSSRWMNQQHPPFAWQQGYGAFSLGQSQRQTVISYIGRQPEHHKKWSFEEEFITLLRRYHITYDPQFVYG